MPGRYAVRPDCHRSATCISHYGSPCASKMHNTVRLVGRYITGLQCGFCVAAFIWSGSEVFGDLVNCCSSVGRVADFGQEHDWALLVCRGLCV
jgi:hypothetical protein